MFRRYLKRMKLCWIEEFDFFPSIDEPWECRSGNNGELTQQSVTEAYVMLMIEIRDLREGAREMKIEEIKFWCNFGEQWWIRVLEGIAIYIKDQKIAEEVWNWFGSIPKAWLEVWS